MIFSENCHILLPPSSFAYSAQEGANSETLEAYIFGCIGVRTVELATPVLWLLKFLQRKPWSSSLLMRRSLCVYQDSR